MKQQIIIIVNQSNGANVLYVAVSITLSIPEFEQVKNDRLSTGNFESTPQAWSSHGVLYYITKCLLFWLLFVALQSSPLPPDNMPGQAATQPRAPPAAQGAQGGPPQEESSGRRIWNTVQVWSCTVWRILCAPNCSIMSMIYRPW